MKKTQSINGEWKLYLAPEKGGVAEDFSEELIKNWQFLEAEVPGCVQLELQKAGIEPEPFYADNVIKYAKYENYQWVYEKTFFVDEDLKGEEYILSFGGIDTIADVYLNGAHVGSPQNMFIEHEYNVTEHLNFSGENKLIVHIHSSMNFVRNKEYPIGMRGTARRNEICHIRKAPHNFGWDIAPRFVTAGIWRGVELQAVSKTRITESYYACSSLGENAITLQYAVRFKTDADNLDGFEVKISGTCEDSSFETRRKAHFVNMNYTMGIVNPKLWWPLGYGEQNLYEVKMELIHNGEVVDVKTERIGLRVFELERSFEPGNQEFKITVNNKPFFAKGTNWVPLDAIHSRDKERVRKAHALLKENGCNMIRCWGGNVYEDSEFFDLCDEAGILVWQDFAMGNTNYPQTLDFVPIMEEEIGSVIKKLRNHPSIALWCTDNEIDYKNEGFELPSRDSYYNRVAYETLPRICATHDPYRILIKSSPEIPEGFNMYNVPEQHRWGPRAWFKDDFYAKHTAKFISEFGFHGCPSPSGIKKYIPDEYYWPLDNDIWAVHSTEDITIGKSNSRNQMMRNHVRIMYGEVPEDIETFALLSQLYQAEALKFMMEHCRADSGFRGLLWWNMIDCWPQISDSIVDYYFNKKVAFHYIKRCQRPQLCFITPMVGWEYPVFLSNHCHDAAEVKVTVTDGDTGEELFSGEATIGADETKKIGSIRGIISEQRLFVIKYELNGKSYANHFITGFPTYKAEDMLRWFEIIRKLEKEEFNFVP